MTDHQLPVADAELVACAARIRANAYACNSHFPVGAALLTGRGAVIEGASVENAAIGSTICAERSAICRAISEGHRDFIAVAIVADAELFCSPCGACRQFLGEFNPRMRVLRGNLRSEITEQSLEELHPYHFGPSFVEAGWM
jgi:cytidine deaminase